MGTGQATVISVLSWFGGWQAKDREGPMGVTGMLPLCGHSPASGHSVDSLHPLVVRIEGGLQVNLGSVRDSHPLQSIVPTLHEVQRDLRVEGTRVTPVLRWALDSSHLGRLTMPEPKPSPDSMHGHTVGDQGSLPCTRGSPYFPEGVR